MKRVVVLPYDPGWAAEFDKIKSELDAALSIYVIAINHVGSTAVVGLSAKPIIDIDITIKNYSDFEQVRDRLASIGYDYEGDLGIKDRHTFRYCGKEHLMEHHVYVCPEYSAQLADHLAFRDHLRTHKKDRDRYSEVKLLSARHYPDSMEKYMIAKAPIIADILSKIRGEQ